MRREIIQRIKDIAIERVAEELEIEVKRHKCRCPFHEDKHPSMKMYVNSNTCTCFVCGKTWNSVSLVMGHENLDYREALLWIAGHNNIIVDDERNTTPLTTLRSHKRCKATKTRMTCVTNTTKEVVCPMPEEYVTSRLSTCNMFCRSLVNNGILTEEQMLRAAHRYRVGTAKDGGVIFWQIDDQLRVRDGKIMYYSHNCHRNHSKNPNWISNLMKNAHLTSPDSSTVKCLFGLHLLSPVCLPSDSRQSMIIAIVESEKTAIIMSERMPQYTHDGITSPVIWLATGGLSFLTTQMLRPIAESPLSRRFSVIIFPDTDTDGTAYRTWCTRANEASKVLNFPFPVSDFLERHATPEQKARKIDIADKELSVRENAKA